MRDSFDDLFIETFIFRNSDDKIFFQKKKTEDALRKLFAKYSTFCLVEFFVCIWEFFVVGLFVSFFLLSRPDSKVNILDFWFF